MLNLCIFIFIVYAVSYSAKEIIFGNNTKRRAINSKASQKRKIAVTKQTIHKNNITAIRAGRLEKSKRPIFLQM